MINVAVVGASGRMGKAVVAAVQEADDLELVAELDAADDLAQATRAQAEVAVERGRGQVLRVRGDRGTSPP